MITSNLDLAHHAAHALADRGRIRILMAVEEGELCVCEITELLRLAPSTVSKHLSVLHEAGLLTSRKEGRWVYYSRNDETTIPGIAQLLAWLSTLLKEDPEIVADRKRLQSIVTERNGQCRP